MTDEYLEDGAEGADVEVTDETPEVQGPVVRVARVTEGMQEVPFTPGMTVSQAIELASYSVGGEDQVRLNNEPVTDLDTTVPEDGTILILQKITGN